MALRGCFVGSYTGVNGVMLGHRSGSLRLTLTFARGLAGLVAEGFGWFH